MNPQDYTLLLPHVIATALQAGARIMEVYTQGFNVQRKDDHSPLTCADVAAHDTIVAGLSALEPVLPILSEEDAKIIPYAERAQWPAYWLVDPLDGTREFVKRNGEFTVNIALIVAHSPVIGVVYVPMNGDCYYACRGTGAYKQNGAAPAQRIRVRPLPADTLAVAGSRSHADANFDLFLQNLNRPCQVITIGSSLKSCLVAEGKVDLYPRLGPTSEWDTAAAQCVVEEAGGKLTDIHLQPLRYNTKESLLNPWFLVFGDTQENWTQYLPRRP